ncbi:type II secretion system protein M [Curvibacter sp. CHRR-16]|uniref:type II secretion system protein GspM n=1 Tax=Curvibacter sp. CHRR-16 TaxID=2835872 RepID=UPI001BDADD3D|nr:type II secretion system protein GspM [Curvibacter sp. CHRR-16]MBT0569150.1 type II secretion system protein M [Curvibacter sp. CHRR-16]
MNTTRLPTLPPAVQEAIAKSQTWWRQRPPRERQLLSAAALLLVCCIAWYGFLAPTLKTLRTFETRYNAQQAQWQTMLLLQEQARQLQKNPAMDSNANPQQFLQALTQSDLGASANLTQQGSMAVVTLTGTANTMLYTWLREVREQARLLPHEVQIQYSPEGWHGRITFALNGNG